MPEIDFNNTEIRAYINEKSETMNNKQRKWFRKTIDDIIIGSDNEKIGDYNIVTGIVDIIADHALNE